MRLVDLSHPLEHGQLNFAFDPKISVVTHNTISSIGYNITQISMSTHQGTDLDAPFHFFDDGKTLDQLGLDVFYGPASLIDLAPTTCLEPGTQLTLEMFEPHASVFQPGARVIYRTGWDRMFGRPEFFTDFPSLTLEAARWLASRRISLLGTDTPTPSFDWLECHHILLQKGVEIVIVEYPEQFGTHAGLVMMAGIVVMIADIVTCAAAGRMKEKGDGSVAAGGRASSRRAALGLVFCVLAGLLSPMVNFALIFGRGVADSAARYGATPGNANNAIWALVFNANYAVNVLYCLWLMRKNRTLANYRTPGTARYWVGAVIMGLLWAGGVVVYGAGATRIGRFGPFFGFPVMLISSILTGNVLGALSGEWTGDAARPKRVMATGVAILILAIGLLGFANTLIGLARP